MSGVAESNKLPGGGGVHACQKFFEMNMRWHAIWCILRHNCEKCYGVCTDLVASEFFSDIVTYRLWWCVKKNVSQASYQSLQTTITEQVCKTTIYMPFNLLQVCPSVLLFVALLCHLYLLPFWAVIFHWCFFQFSGGTQRLNFDKFRRDTASLIKS